MARGKQQTISVHDQLELFVFRTEQLNSTRLIRNRTRTSFQISATPNKLEFSSSEPDDEDLRSYLVFFRQFISESEPIHLGRIHGVCMKHFTSEKLKAYLIDARQHWKKDIMNKGVILNYNGHPYTPEDLTDYWINGYYFHNDMEKLKMLRALLPHERMLVRSLFLSHTIGATNQVLYYGEIIKIALRESLISD